MPQGTWGVQGHVVGIRIHTHRIHGQYTQVLHLNFRWRSKRKAQLADIIWVLNK